MKKILHVALRELASTVLTKGFLFGVLMTPVMIGIVVVALPMLINEEPPKIDGEIVLIDPTGQVAGPMRTFLAPTEVAERREATAEKIREAIPENLRPFAKEEVGDMDKVLGSVPELRLTEMPTDTDLEAEKAPLLVGTSQDGGRLAIAVVHDNAIDPDDAGTYGTYDLYIREKLDDRLIDEIKDGLRDSIVDARVRARGLDPADISALTRLPRVRPKTVTDQGERENLEVLNMLLPAGFMVLLLISCMTGGQYLMTTVIEEKSSRVVEVLLSAVSPMELMTGKILGQLAVGLIVLGLYAGMGIAGLVSFSLLGLVDPWLIFYLIIFYLISYFVVGSFMAAIGAAVNEMREAQTLMMPVVLVIMIPWMLWMPISRDPNSLFATIASLVPPINPFVMLLRMTSTTPPPMWQVWLSIGIGIASVYAALWMAAKIFRIGILMHGKPPNFTTLIRWLRMA